MTSSDQQVLIGLGIMAISLIVTFLIFRAEKKEKNNAPNT
jgi:hypothetical protein